MTEEEKTLLDAIEQLENRLHKLEILRNDHNRLREALCADFRTREISMTQEKLQSYRDRLAQLQSQNQNNMELKITKEKVREAAAKCPTADATLRTLFPEAFEEDKYFDLTKLIICDAWAVFNQSNAISAGFNGNSFIQVRSSDDEELFGKAFFLAGKYNWELKPTNSGDDYLLIPTRKNK